MKKKILIISSDLSGHGHKSVTSALCEQLQKYPDVAVHVVDGFALAKNQRIRIDKLYGFVTRYVRGIWRIFADISFKYPAFMVRCFENAIRAQLEQLLDDIQPHVILSVHPAFNGSVVNILEKNKLNIPFGTLIIDLVNITPLWADPRADFIIVPTQEAKEQCTRVGVAESKILMMDFPVREKFFYSLHGPPKREIYAGHRPLECLIMSGAEGVGPMEKVAQILLQHFDCRVNIITGRNTRLKKRLDRALQHTFSDRITVYGFVENIPEMMFTSDIVFTRASSSVILEAISCEVPLVIIDHLPGQEEGIPEYCQTHHLGVSCEDFRNLRETVESLLANRAEKWREIQKSQRTYRNPEAALNIVKFLVSLEPLAEIHDHAK